MASETEFTAIADSMDDDLDRIYEYVRNTVRTTPQFGLSKGGYGAMIDGAGTPFDQADLMIRLVRASGGTADFVYGDITVTGAEFEDWFGPSSARGACELLAVGGIPAQINSSSATSCSGFSNNADTLSSVRMRHAWVRVNVSGTNYHFDPSFKALDRTGRVDAIFNAAPSGADLRTASGGSQQGSGVSGVDEIDGFDAGAIRTELSGHISAVRTAIETAESSTEATDHAGTVDVAHIRRTRELVGGGDIIRERIVGSGNGPRDTALPNVVSGTVSTFNELPEELRTWVHIRVLSPTSSTMVDETFDASKLGGRTIMLNPGNILAAPITNTIGMSIVVDDETIAGGSYTAPTEGLHLANVSVTIGVEIDHPYFGGASGASQADAEYTFGAPGSFSSVVVLGLGERGDRAELRNTALFSGSGRYGWSVGQCVPNPMCEFPTDSAYQKSGKTNSIVASGENWLTNASRLLEIYEGVAGGRRVTNHLIGVSSVTIDIVDLTDQLGGQQLSLDISGSLGYAQNDSSSNDREAFAFASGSALAALEQAVLKGQADTPSVNGTASMFEWFVESDTNLERAYGPDTYSLAALQARFLSVTSANETSADTLLWQGEDQSGNQINPTTPFDEHTDDGFTVISPQSLRLGPVRDSSRQTTSPNDQWDSCSKPNANDCTIEDFDGADAWQTRSLGYLAWDSDATAVRIAPISDGRFKGGGAANFPEEIETPTASQEALNEAYETWATAFSVDDRTGGLTLTPPPDLSVGAGDFPYSLAFQRTYSSDRGWSGPLGFGWTHNFDVRLSLGTDVGAALGTDTPRSAVSTFITAKALLDLFETSNTASRQEDLVTAQLALNWWADSAHENIVRIQRGSSTERFFRQPDGAWIAETGSEAQLSQSGSAFAKAGINPVDCPPSPTTCTTAEAGRTISEGYMRDAISFTYTSASNVVESFTYGVDATTTMYAPEHMSSNGGGPIVSTGSTYLRRTTTYPYGMVITYGYTSGNGLTEYLTSITNSAPFSRTINLVYETNPLGLDDLSDDAPVPIAGSRGAQVRLASINDGNGRSVSFDYAATAPSKTEHTATLIEVSDVMAELTKYAYTDSMPIGVTPGVTESRMRLTELYMPHDGTNPFFTFGYDADGRANAVTNARPRSWLFYNAGGVRGHNKTPLGHSSFTQYDEHGLPAVSVSLRSITTESTFDGAGRTLTRSMGNSAHAYPGQYGRWETFYDGSGNTVIERTLSTTNSSGTPLSSDVIEAVSEFTYSNFPNLPTRSYDPLGNETRMCYHTSQAGCSGVETSSSHDGLLRREEGPSGERTQYYYLGSTLGRLSEIRTTIATGVERRTSFGYFTTNGLPFRATQHAYSGSNHSVTNFNWDQTGNLIRVTDPEGRETRAYYRSDRRINELISGNQDAGIASLTRYRYDNSHRLRYVDQAATVSGTPDNYTGTNWITTDVRYTSWGRLDQIIDPDGDSRRFFYDSSDRNNSIHDGEGTSEEIVTRMFYYEDGALYCTQVADGTSEERTIRRYYVGADGEPNRWFNGNHVTPGGCNVDSSYVSRTLYDAFYRATGHRFDNGSEVTGVMDDAGNVTSATTRAGETSNHVYDASNRLVSETFGTDGDQSYTYNFAGERTQAIWETAGYPGPETYRVTTDYAYDYAGRVLSETRSHDRTSPSSSTSYATQYEYDLSGLRTAIIWPDGYTARYRYDGAGRLDLVCEDADGSTSTGSAGGVAGCNTILSAYAYDRLGRRTQSWFDAGTGTNPSSPSSEITYSYEDDSDLVSLEHEFSTSANVTFDHSYNATGRLTATHASAPGWLWDAGGVSFTRDYDTDHVDDPTGDDLDQLDGHTTTGGITDAIAYTYDNNGNRFGLLDGGAPTSITNHDMRNRLISMGSYYTGGGWSPPSGSTYNSWLMEYDADGRRILMSSNISATLEFVHAGDMEIADVDYASGKILRRYVPGAMVDERVAMITTVAGSCTGPCGAASREFYHANRLGTVIALADESGTLTAQYIYTPFGVETPVSGSANPFRYTGQRADTETGLMYYRARYYDPVAGRFLQTDPVMYADQMNLYAYVGNGPLMLVDPSGEFGEQPFRGCCSSEKNPNRVTIERIANGRGAGPNGGVSIRSAQTDIRSTHDPFSDFAERSAAVTVGIGMAGQGAVVTGGALTATNAGAGFGNLVLGAGLTGFGTQTAVDGVHGDVSIQRSSVAGGGSALTAFSAGAVPVATTGGLIAAGMMAAAAGMLGAAVENGAETTGSDLADGALNGFGDVVMDNAPEMLSDRN